jgi:hypothetical protein
MSTDYIIEVFVLATGEVVKVIPCGSEASAEKALVGLLRQINSATYGAAMKQKEPKQ